MAKNAAAKTEIKTEIKSEPKSKGSIAKPLKTEVKMAEKPVLRPGQKTSSSSRLMSSPQSSFKIEIEADIVDTKVAAKVADRITSKMPSKNAGKFSGKTSDKLSDKLTVKPVEWIELFPQGIALATEVGRPVLLLKNDAGTETLPVWLNHLDAGLALAEFSQGNGVSPHNVSRKILSSMNVKVVECRINELSGHHQFAELKMTGNPNQTVLRVRADEAMSFVLQNGAKIFSTRPFMEKCRNAQVELENFEQGIVSGKLGGFQVRPEISSKKFPYMM
jgi:bifunctional DNase/RNase